MRQPKLDKKLCQDVIRGFEGMMRLAHMSSGIESLYDACSTASVKGLSSFMNG